MFLLRSAFWLTLAFVIIRPDVDVRSSAMSLQTDAMARGSQFVSQQIEAIDCDSFQCIGGKALASAALKSTLPAGTPMHVLPALDTVPLPRPRPDDLG